MLCGSAGLCGGSASGKTTVANKIIEALDVPWVVLLSMDSFYKVSETCILVFFFCCCLISFACYQLSVGPLREGNNHLRDEMFCHLTRFEIHIQSQHLKAIFILLSQFGVNELL